MSSEPSDAMADSDRRETLESLLQQVELTLEEEELYQMLRDEHKRRFLKSCIARNDKYMRVLEKKDEQLEKKDEQLEKKDEQLYQGTLCFSYGFTSGDNAPGFKQIPININTAVIPSNEGHSRRTTIVNTKGEEEKVRIKIPAAENIIIVEKMWVEIENIKFSGKDSEGKYIPSILAAEAWSPEKRVGFTYANEFGVQHYCRGMIKDALNALGLSEMYVQIHLELSIYMMKPDIVIVLRREGRIIFVVEVKSPEHGNHKVFDNKNVGGQIWSYLYAMKAAGDEQPLGAIMTYNKIALVSLADYSKNNDSSVTNQFVQAVNKAKELLSTGTAIDLSSKEEEENCVEQASTPERIKKSLSSTTTGSMEEISTTDSGGKKSTAGSGGEKLAAGSEEGKLAADSGEEKSNSGSGEGKVAADSEEERYTDEEEVKRSVYYSRTEEGGNVFPCLLQALCIAYIKANGNDSPSIPYIENGDSLRRRLSLKVGKDFFQWVRLPSHKEMSEKFTSGKYEKYKNVRKKELQEQLKSRNMNVSGTKLDLCIRLDPSMKYGPFTATWTNDIKLGPIKNFHVLGKLGEGQKASVYLCCTRGGLICAIKDYHLRPSFASTPEVRDREEFPSRKKVYDQAVLEKERWIEIYGNSYPADIKTLGGRTTLVMPYGHEIDSSHRWDFILDIQILLQQFAEKGYRYEKSDLRWHHVLRDSTGKIFLCDLESLTSIGKNSNADERKRVVYEQLNILLKPLFTDQHIKDARIWLHDTKVEEVIASVKRDKVLSQHFDRVGTTDWSSYIKSLVDDFPETNLEAMFSLRMVAYFKLSCTQDTSTPASSPRKPKKKRKRNRK